MLTLLVIVADQLFDLFADLFLLRTALNFDFDLVFDFATLIYEAF